MQTPNKASKKLIEFNCKNGVYAVDSTVKPLIKKTITIK